MNLEMMESFTWVDNSVAGKAAIRTRYNVTNGPDAIIVGGGRFAGNCVECTGNQWQFNYPKGGVGPDVVYGFAFKTTNTLTGFIIFQVFAGSTGVGNEQLSLRSNPTGAINLCRGGTVLATTAKILQANTFYYLELAVHFNGATGSMTLWIDGVQSATVAVANTDPNGTGGSFSAAFGAGPVYHFCDQYMISGTLVPLGPQRVSLKMPTANGALQDWTPSAGNAFDRVKTVPPDGDANGYISSNTPGNQSTFLFGALPYVPATINGVQVSLYARFDDGGPHEVATLIKSGATVDVGATQSVSANYLDFYLQCYVHDPNTGVNWTAAGVDAAEYGVDLVL